MTKRGHIGNLIFVAILFASLGVTAGIASGSNGPPINNLQTEYTVIVEKVEFRTNTVEYQGDRLVLNDYYEKRGNRWFKSTDSLTISGNYIVRQQRMTIMGGP